MTPVHRTVQEGLSVCVCIYIYIYIYTHTYILYIYAYKIVCPSARNQGRNSGGDMAVKAGIHKLIGTNQVLTGIKSFFFFFFNLKTNLYVIFV